MRVKKAIYRTLVFLIMVANVVNGYVRHEYHLNFTESKQGFLVKRKEARGKSYPTDLETLTDSIKEDYRWGSTVYYSVFAIASTLLVIYLLFEKRTYVWICLVLYGSTFLLMGLLVGVSFLSNNYAVGYGIAQYFKNLIQTPIFSFIVVAGLYLFKNRKNAV